MGIIPAFMEAEGADAGGQGCCSTCRELQNGAELVEVDLAARTPPSPPTTVMEF